MTASFLWYDLETFGRDPRRTRIAQFAAIRTDLELREIGEPISIHCRPADDLLPSPEAVGDSLYEALEDAGNRPVRALQRLRALLLRSEQAKLLHAAEGDAGLLVERVGFLRDGRAVEFCQSYYRGDTYDFVAELTTE